MKARLACLLLTLAGLTPNCHPIPREFACGGRTMGTTWSLRSLNHPPDQAQIQRQLDSLEAIFSTWQSGSEISRFNRHPPAQPFPVSPELAAVFLAARDIHARSGGVFDPTVGALTAAFGFGPLSLANPAAQPGLHEIAFDPAQRTLRRGASLPTLDLSALVEGFALERIALCLQESGHRNFLLEIGGELLARGPGPDGRGWSVGIQAPGDADKRSVTAIRLRDEALSTSGTYRQMGVKDGVSTTHVIDPRTCRPVCHDTLSVSVIAPNAMETDAWATALLVLGAEAGQKLAEQQNLEALFLKAASPTAPQEANASAGAP